MASLVILVVRMAREPLSPTAQALEINVAHQS